MPYGNFFDKAGVRFCYATGGPPRPTNAVQPNQVRVRKASREDVPRLATWAGQKPRDEPAFTRDTMLVLVYQVELVGRKAADFTQRPPYGMIQPGIPAHPAGCPLLKANHAGSFYGWQK